MEGRVVSHRCPSRRAAAVCRHRRCRTRGNRPIWVKHFQALHRCVVDVARGLALLFGLGTKALPSWDSKTRSNNHLVDLAVNVTAGSRGHTNSPHPSSREGHHSTHLVELDFLLLHLVLIALKPLRLP